MNNNPGRYKECTRIESNSWVPSPFSSQRAGGGASAFWLSLVLSMAYRFPATQDTAEVGQAGTPEKRSKARTQGPWTKVTQELLLLACSGDHMGSGDPIWVSTHKTSSLPAVLLLWSPGLSFVWS